MMLSWPWIAKFGVTHSHYIYFTPSKGFLDIATVNQRTEGKKSVLTTKPNEFKLCTNRIETYFYLGGDHLNRQIWI